MSTLQNVRAAGAPRDRQIDDASAAENARAAGEARSQYQLREHYVIERELADRLRAAPRAERPRLYAEVYDELFRRVPYHPQLRAVSDTEKRARRSRSVEQQHAFLAPYLRPGLRFMEIGAGDCALSLRVAQFASRVYAVEVSDEITRGARRPPNLEVVLTEGSRVPVPAGSVDVAFSNQLMEHLHPEDAADQLAEVSRALAPGGAYLCITPNRLYGPRDVSAHFDEVATGLHLREYLARELRSLMLGSGFSEVRFYAGGAGRFVRCPYAAVAAFESMLERLPYRLRKRVADNPPARALLGLRIAALK
jgi:SAM-dependent methyltransferase